MIIYLINCNNDQWVIDVTGHANYANSGKDIVCASVSTALIMTYNLIERLGYKDLITKEICDEGNFQLIVNNNDVINTIIVNLKETFKELETKFPKYINSKN